MTKFTLYKMQHLPTGPHFKGSLTDDQLENLLKKDKSLLKTHPDKSIYMISLTCLNKSNLVLNCLRRIQNTSWIYFVKYHCCLTR